MSDVVAELKPLIELLLAKVEGVEARLARVEAEVAGLKDEMAVMKAVQIRQNERLAGIEGRLEEQGRVLVALIPTRVAAVGSRTAAE